MIGVPHPKWLERPLLIVVPERPDAIDREQMLAWFVGKVVKWWVPDDVVFVTELPHTATGKLKKAVLREQFAAYELAVKDAIVK